MRTRGRALAGAGAVPELAFRIEDAGVQEFAAVPTLRFALGIESVDGGEVRAIALNVQIRIAAERRSYDAAERERLVELFGVPEQWAASLRSLFWTQATLQVPAFVGVARIDLPVTCTYDFEITAAKYFHALENGAVPLEFLFSGTVFYPGDDGSLRAARISWEQEAAYRLPVAVWKEMMQHYFPNSAWIRLRRDAFDRLYAYKASHTLPTWEAVIDALLPGGEMPWTR